MTEARNVTVAAATSQADLVECFLLRTAVFVLEQKVPPELELDEYDKDCFHVLARVDGVAVGTGRLANIDGGWKIGRLAVERAQRGYGFGKALVNALEEIGKTHGVETIKLASQTHAIGFYAELRYEVYGDVFLDAGIEHRWMKKRL